MLISSAAEKHTDRTLSYPYRSELLLKNSLDTAQFCIDDIDSFVHLEIQPHQASQLRENDRIKRLPGQPEADFEQYGGYVTVDQVAGRALYYYFVETKTSQKHSLPLLLWLNGGPGCSSFGYGAMQELGPFHVCSDGKTLYKNKFSWNNAANVLFLESPAGVGFSYSNTTADFTTGGDRRTTIDNYAFLLNWLERFPEYKRREFYISGESYIGHYGAMLAQTILHNNRKAKTTLINLKGIIIGNPSLEDEADDRGMIEYLGNHAIISGETTAQILKHCDFPINIDKGSSYKCLEAQEELNTNIAGINPYNIYAPLCLNSNLTEKPKKTAGRDIDPCILSYVNAYLNRADVQQALHANVTKLHYGWSGCSVVIKEWTDSPSTVMPLIKDLLGSNLRVWIYSGDVDARIPFTTTNLCFEKMKLHPKSAYLPWYSGGQIGGYTQEYEGNLRFATVRGAGHQVPAYQPERALTLIRHFLAGKDLPTRD
ncbi:serine carboxypeptidase-like 40 [Andrographis paniculata]|uniref:serine carboxypeptidase-like 40 n=1 Tax=Andrographis paniculata TaxID=175694 RepID=UPI0021E8452E|nr:serine carboxypeptidase-like 40 [Andrographis paniculata]